MKLLKTLKHPKHRQDAVLIIKKLVDIQMVNINGMVKKPVTKEMLNNVQNQLFQLTIIDKRYF
jgi:mannose/fructose/N-acetylgalactosamine-specific phosphotransferase system component IIB